MATKTTTPKAKNKAIKKIKKDVQKAVNKGVSETAIEQAIEENTGNSETAQTKKKSGAGLPSMEQEFGDD